MGIITLGNNKIKGKTNLPAPRINLGDGTYLKLTTDKSKAVPGTNLKLEKSGRTYWISDIDRIIDIFPDPVVAQFIATKLNKGVNSEVTDAELATIKGFGIKTDMDDNTFVSSWIENELILKGKTISSFVGIERLTGLTAFILKDVILTGDALNIDLSFTDNLIHFSYAFQNSAIKSIKFGKLDRVKALNYTFESCNALNYIELPPKMANLYIEDVSDGKDRLFGSRLDKTGRTIKYNADVTVTNKNQIVFHNPSTGTKYYTQSTLDYSNLNL